MSIVPSTTLNEHKPAIRVSRTDYERLLKLASAAADRSPVVAEELLGELDRADVVDDLPADVIRMGSTVEYAADDGLQRRVTLVYPGQADIALGRISILTPIGAALIGLSAGQFIGWTTLDGRKHILTVIAVENVELPAGESV